MFLSGGVVSAAISVAPMDLITTLASCFLTLSLAGLGLNTLIIQRYKPAFNIG
ncbi:hypothetical protein D3C87_1983020 [compost metagenome]